MDRAAPAAVSARPVAAVKATVGDGEGAIHAAVDAVILGFINQSLTDDCRSIDVCC